MLRDVNSSFGAGRQSQPKCVPSYVNRVFDKDLGVDFISVVFVFSSFPKNLYQESFLAFRSELSRIHEADKDFLEKFQNLAIWSLIKILCGTFTNYGLDKDFGVRFLEIPNLLI